MGENSGKKSNVETYQLSNKNYLVKKKESILDKYRMTEVGLPGGVNPLDFLHKLATQRGLTRPEFLQLGEQGLPHNKLFMWQCSFNNVVAQATGRSKKEAKVAAARAVRDQLNFEELPPAPTHQSVIEKKKRKIEGGENGDGKGKKQKYDYNRHFQCYGAGNQGFGMGMP